MGGGSGGRENWPDSWNILEAEPTGFAQISHMSVKGKK